MRYLVFSLLTLLYSQMVFAEKYDTLQIYFQLDKTELSEKSSHCIDSLIKNNLLEQDKKIIVLGYCDYLGSSDYNNKLSYIRAKNVQDYLISSGYNAANITLCMGKGKIQHNATGKKDGVSADRKVQLIYFGKIDTPVVEKFSHYIKRLKDDETLPLNGIHFFRGSLRLTPESLPSVNMLAEFMLHNKTYKIQLEGHVCCLGPYPGYDEPYDESTLSTKRAELIRDTLIAHGIDKTRLKAIGLGNRNPIVEIENTPEEQELNRRVEIKVVGR